MCNHPFVTIASDKEHVSHVPVLVRQTEHGLNIQGHVARANGDWKHWMEQPEVLVIFQGPHVYVSPTMFQSAGQVPTWNYAVVHAIGKLVLREDAEWLDTFFAHMTQRFEPKDGGWRYDPTLSHHQTLKQMIVGFEVEIKHIEAKFKLSQNRSKEDREALLHALQKDPSENAQATARLMEY